MLLAAAPPFNTVQTADRSHAQIHNLAVLPLGEGRPGAVMRQQGRPLLYDSRLWRQAMLRESLLQRRGVLRMLKLGFGLHEHI